MLTFAALSNIRIIYKVIFSCKVICWGIFMKKQYVAPSIKTEDIKIGVFGKYQGCGGPNIGQDSSGGDSGSMGLLFFHWRKRNRN
jgi:hypothetical protein